MIATCSVWSCGVACLSKWILGEMWIGPSGNSVASRCAVDTSRGWAIVVVGDEFI
jgi:hypothetical protein